MLTKPVAFSGILSYDYYSDGLFYFNFPFLTCPFAISVPAAWPFLRLTRNFNSFSIESTVFFATQVLRKQQYSPQNSQTPWMMMMRLNPLRPPQKLWACFPDLKPNSGSLKHSPLKRGPALTWATPLSRHPAILADSSVHFVIRLHL